jgi:hypothetical protein
MSERLRRPGSGAGAAPPREVGDGAEGIDAQRAPQSPAAAHLFVGASVKVALRRRDESERRGEHSAEQCSLAQGAVLEGG